MTREEYFNKDFIMPRLEENGHHTWDFHTSDLKDAMKWADEHPKSPWTKCSERMPPFINFGEYKRNDVSVNKEVIQRYEDTENVVVLYKNGNVDIDYCTLYTTVDIDNGKKIKKEYTWGKFRTDVLAWMPIPKFNKE